MYQTISIAAFLVVIGLLGVDCLFLSRTKCWLHPVKSAVHLFTLLFLEQKLSLAGALRKLVFLLALLCFVVLAVTGFYHRLVLNQPITGWLLMIHATFAPIMAICLAILAVMRAGESRFSKNDWPWFERLIQKVTLVKITDGQTHENNICVGQKICFWLIIFLALPLILSVIMSMLPYFGTHWQELFIAIHRYSALAFALAVITQIYLLVRVQLKQS
jgi:cytochrome b subunit of formate dehydrogenase